MTRKLQPRFQPKVKGYQHLVAPGDTVGAIAGSLGGDPLRYPQLVGANPQLPWIEHEDSPYLTLGLEVGQKLYIPAKWPEPSGGVKLLAGTAPGAVGYTAEVQAVIDWLKLQPFITPNLAPYVDQIVVGTFVPWFKEAHPGVPMQPGLPGFAPIMVKAVSFWQGVGKVSPTSASTIDWSGWPFETLTWVKDANLAGAMGSLANALRNVGWKPTAVPKAPLAGLPWDETWSKPVPTLPPPFDKPDIWPKLPLDWADFAAVADAIQKAWKSAGKDPLDPKTQAEIASLLSKLQACPQVIPKDPTAMLAFFTNLAKNSGVDPCAAPPGPPPPPGPPGAGAKDNTVLYVVLGAVGLVAIIALASRSRS